MTKEEIQAGARILDEINLTEQKLLSIQQKDSAVSRINMSDGEWLTVYGDMELSNILKGVLIDYYTKQIMLLGDDLKGL